MSIRWEGKTSLRKKVVIVIEVVAGRKIYLKF